MQIFFAYSAFKFFGLYTPVWLLRFPEFGLKIRNWINFWKLLKVYQSQLQSGYLEECSRPGFPHGYSRKLKVTETDKAVFSPCFAGSDYDCAIKLMTSNLASLNRLPQGNNNYHNRHSNKQLIRGLNKNWRFLKWRKTTLTKSGTGFLLLSVSKFLAPTGAQEVTMCVCPFGHKLSKALILAQIFKQSVSSQ